jgi:hypothetical protein
VVLLIELPSQKRYPLGNLEPANAKIVPIGIKSGAERCDII